MNVQNQLKSVSYIKFLLICFRAKYGNIDPLSVDGEGRATDFHLDVACNNFIKRNYHWLFLTNQIICQIIRKSINSICESTRVSVYIDPFRLI